MADLTEKIRNSLVKRPEFLGLLKEFESIKSSLNEMRGLLNSDSSGFRTNLQSHAQRLTEMEDRITKLFSDGKLEAEDAGKKLKEELTGLIDDFKKEIYSRTFENRGGAIGTKFTNEGTMISTRYKDVNFIPIDGLSMSESDDNQNRRVNLTLGATNGTVISGSGTINKVPIFTAQHIIGDSNFSQDGSGNFLVNGIATTTITGGGGVSEFGGDIRIHEDSGQIIFKSVIGQTEIMRLKADRISGSGILSISGAAAGEAKLSTQSISGTQNYTFPNQSGVFALTTNANGTFTTVDSKTVTVVNGIITSII